MYSSVLLTPHPFCLGAGLYSEALLCSGFSALFSMFLSVDLDRAPLCASLNPPRLVSLNRAPDYAPLSPPFPSFFAPLLHLSHDSIRASFHGNLSVPGSYLPDGDVSLWDLGWLAPTPPPYHCYHTHHTHTHTPLSPMSLASCHSLCNTDRQKSSLSSGVG